MSTKVLEGLFILQSFTTTLIMSLLHGVKLITHKDNVSSPEESFKDYALCSIQFSHILFVP